MGTRVKLVNHCLVRSAERIKSQSLGLVHWLTGPRGEEVPHGEPVEMFNAFEESIPRGRMCIAVESPELVDVHQGATWEIVCPKILIPPNSERSSWPVEAIDRRKRVGVV